MPPDSKAPTAPLRRARHWLAALAALGAIAGCSGSEHYAYPLMPTPLVYREADERAAREHRAPDGKAGVDILYATLRPPAPGGAYPFYEDERGDALRLGVAGVAVAETGLSRLDIRALARSAERDRDITLRVDRVEEFGVLERSLTPFSAPETAEQAPGFADERFAREIDRLLERSPTKDVYVYVHGYKVPFSDPVIVAAEFWHYLGYEGAFVAFSWPATPDALAYFTDSDSAAVSTRFFRDFLYYLDEATGAERIHILGYSAGTRMVFDTLHQIALQQEGAQPRKPRLGNVVLSGSDVDRAVLGMRLEDGILDQIDGMTIYMSDSDAALGLLRWFVSRPRVGELWPDGTVPQPVSRYLFEQDHLTMISVREAEAYATGNGHGYYRDSPWVSSDILALLMLDLRPEERGLARRADAVWMFPDDYPDRATGAARAVAE